MERSNGTPTGTSRQSEGLHINRPWFVPRQGRRFFFTRCIWRSKVIKTMGTTYDGFSGQCFRIFEIIFFFCFVVEIYDIVHDVGAIFTLP